MEFELKGKVELFESKKATWHMIFLPKGLSRDLKRLFAGMTAGFGSLPVEVTIGKTVWRTSIFPESKDGPFLMLLKAEVRKKEKIQAGDKVKFLLKVLV